MKQPVQSYRRIPFATFDTDWHSRVGRFREVSNNALAVDIWRILLASRKIVGLACRRGRVEHWRYCRRVYPCPKLTVALVKSLVQRYSGMLICRILLREWQAFTITALCIDENDIASDCCSSRPWKTPAVPVVLPVQDAIVPNGVELVTNTTLPCVCVQEGGGLRTAT